MSAQQVTAEAPSQLAPKPTNELLLDLCRSFQNKEFTARSAAESLRLGFLYTAKALCRMSRKPYYLLSVVRRARLIHGGFENVYCISPRGWKKIQYLNSKRETAGQEVINPMHQVIAGTQLLSPAFTGKPMEHIVCGLSKAWTSSAPLTYSPVDEIGRLLIGVDPGFLIAETIYQLQSSWFRSSCRSAFHTALRAARLQQLGYIPKKIKLVYLAKYPDPVDWVPGNMMLAGYVQNAYDLGNSEPAIIISLLIRGQLEHAAEHAKQLARHEKREGMKDKKIAALEENLTKVYGDLIKVMGELEKLKTVDNSTKGNVIADAEVGILETMIRSLNRSKEADRDLACEELKILIRDLLEQFS